MRAIFLALFACSAVDAFEVMPQMLPVKSAAFKAALASYDDCGMCRGEGCSMCRAPKAETQSKQYQLSMSCGMCGGEGCPTCLSMSLGCDMCGGNGCPTCMAPRKALFELDFAA